MIPNLRLRTVTTPTAAEVAALSAVLIDCVAGGASVSFMAPLEPARADAFWRESLADAARGGRMVLVAEDESGIVGTVTVVLRQPENQPHRAEIAKLLVHRRARRRGVGAALLQAAEAAAAAAGKTLLVLDTVSDGEGHRLYARHGWVRVGEIPEYALWPDGRPCATTVFFKRLDPGAPATDGRDRR